MSQLKLSIIMPIFNGEYYVQSSLSSILNQITDAVEVIVVDDGSTDNSANIIRQHFAQYLESSVLKLHIKKNEGVSAARNDAMLMAQGEYIGFMDADDLVLPHYIATLLQAMSHNTDIVEFGYKTFRSSIAEITVNECCYSNKNFGQHAITDLINQVFCKASWYPWTRIFRKKVVMGTLFPVGVKFCEDLMTIPKWYEKSETILVLKEVIYAYRLNPQGATVKASQNYVDNLIQFYATIPKTHQLKYQYWQLAVAGAIVSCQLKLTKDWQLPAHIQQDILKLRGDIAVYLYLEPREIGMLLYPRIFKAIKKLLKK